MGNYHGVNWYIFMSITLPPPHYLNINQCKFYKYWICFEGTFKTPEFSIYTNTI